MRQQDGIKCEVLEFSLHSWETVQHLTDYLTDNLRCSVQRESLCKLIRIRSD